LGWSIEKWIRSSLYEFNLAAAGYWRNWERQTAWLAREINYIAIAGNPNIKQSAKPKSPADFYKLSTDKHNKTEKLTLEEINAIQNKLYGIPEQSDSKN
jgi:hypothetical protein